MKQIVCVLSAALLVSACGKASKDHSKIDPDVLEKPDSTALVAYQTGPFFWSVPALLAAHLQEVSGFETTQSEAVFPLDEAAPQDLASRKATVYAGFRRAPCDPAVALQNFANTLGAPFSETMPVDLRFDRTDSQVGRSQPNFLKATLAVQTRSRTAVGRAPYRIDALVAADEGLCVWMDVSIVPEMEGTAAEIEDSAFVQDLKEGLAQTGARCGITFDR